MVYKWEPQTQYGYGSIVEYQGHKYQIVQPHQSQSDWAPDKTPALWSRVPESYDCDEHEGHHERKPEKWKGEEEAPYHHEQHHNAPPPEKQIPISHEEQKKNWYDIDDKRKKELEIGGGLLAGAALLGGGFLAYREHEKNQEEKKATLWSLQGWLRDAQVRTDEFYRNGPKSPVTWVLNKGKQIPQGAIVGGHERGGDLFIARAFQDGSIQPGKASSVFQKGAVIGFKEHEIQLDTYEILVGDSRAIRWVNTAGHLNLDSLRATPVDGGKEDNGTPLYIAQAPYADAVHPGKCSAALDGAYIPYGGSEKKVKEYAVLCYA